MTAPSETGEPVLSRNFAKGSDRPEISRHQGSKAMNAESEGASGVTECQRDFARAWPEPSEPVLEYAAPQVERTTASKASTRDSPSFEYPNSKPSPFRIIDSTLVQKRRSAFERARSKTATTSDHLSETGNARRSSWILISQPWEANHSRTFLGENVPSASSMKSDHLVYFERSSFFEAIPVVTLHRPHQVMATFLPILEFPSKTVTDTAGTPSSTMVAAAIIQEAQAQITAIFISISDYGRMISAKKRTEKEKRPVRPYFP